MNKPNAPTVLIANHETTPEEISKADIVVTNRGALIKNRHGLTARENDLQCVLTQMTVGDGLVHLHFPDGHTCGMWPAIELGTAVLPSVSIIQTWSGDKPDTVYFRDGGAWQSRLPRL